MLVVMLLVDVLATLLVVAVDREVLVSMHVLLQTHLLLVEAVLEQHHQLQVHQLPERLVVVAVMELVRLHPLRQ
jgi:hypothetical protein